MDYKTASKIGRKGGKRRTETLSAERRKDISAAAIKSRWARERAKKSANTEIEIVEWLGDITTDNLLKNIYNFNPHFNSMEAVRLAAPKGFEVTVEFPQISRKIQGEEAIDFDKSKVKVIRLIPKQ